MSESETQKVFINIDGEQIEIVADEYDNQYLKEHLLGVGYIYIPFPNETSEPDTFKIYQARLR